MSLVLSVISYAHVLNPYLHGATCPNAIEPICANTLGYVNLEFLHGSNMLLPVSNNVCMVLFTCRN
jgi:hypothetical protein